MRTRTASLRRGLVLVGDEGRAGNRPGTGDGRKDVRGLRLVKEAMRTGINVALWKNGPTGED